MSSGLTSLKFGVVTLAAGLLAAGGTAQANPFTFTITGGCSEACGATAVITPGTGTLTLALTNTQANPRSAGDLLSAIEITPSGSLGTPTLSSQAGALITVAGNKGPYSTSAGPPTHWGVGASSGQIVLETAGPFAVGGKPTNMIIGPPDGSGNYSNGNASVVDGHFSPYINGTGTFIIQDAAITSATTISAVTFGFGTSPDTFLPGVPTTPPSVPEPSSLASMGFGLAALGLFLGWRRRQV